MKVQITVDSKEVKTALNGLKADLPWIYQSTVNDLLKGAQQAQYDTMRKNFTIRNAAFLRYSVKISQFASRTTPTGTLGMADIGGKPTGDLWEKFETGGTRTPTKSKNISVPTSAAWPNKGRVLPKRNRPRNLARSFVVKSGGKQYILNRVGRKARPQGDGTDSNVKVMFSLNPFVRIPDKLHFYGTVIPYVNTHYDAVFNKLLTVSISKNKLGR